MRHRIIHIFVTTLEGLLFWWTQVKRHCDMNPTNQGGCQEASERDSIVERKQYHIYRDSSPILKPWLQFWRTRLFSTVEGKQFNITKRNDRKDTEVIQKNGKENIFEMIVQRCLKFATLQLVSCTSVLLRNINIFFYKGRSFGTNFQCHTQLPAKNLATIHDYYSSFSSRARSPTITTVCSSIKVFSS